MNPNRRYASIGAMAAIAALCSVPVTSAEVPAKAVSAEEFRAILQKERGQVLILNFWATWCVPCLREVPDLLALESEMKRQGVKLIGVAVDDPSPGAVQVDRFRQKYFPTFVTYARQGMEMDELASVVDPAWNEVVPTTYILNRQGKVVARIQGKKSREEFRAAIAKAF